MKRFLLPALLAIITIAACKKEKKEAEIDGYKFKNELNEAVNVTLYGSAVDYINRVNPIWTGDINAISTKTVPAEYLTENDSCYIDWHTISHSGSNWIYGQFLLQPYVNNIMFFTSKSKTYSINGSYNYGGNIYPILLKNGVSSKWKVFNAYVTDGYKFESVWDKMDQYQKQMNMNVTFKNITITYPEASGPNIDEYSTLLCRQTGSNFAGVFGMVFNDWESDVYMYNISQPYKCFNWHNSNHIDDPSAKPSIDTLFIWNNRNYVAYAMVRQ